MQPAPVHIPPQLLADVASRARVAYPRECCGYLVGARGAGAVDEVVACTNVADEPDEYAIDGKQLIAFARSFATTRPARIVFHSHANGRAYFSATDHEHALAGSDHPAYPVQHLVVGVAATGCREAALFAWDDDAGAFVAVARFSAQVLG